jgi:hypothetical protein
VIIGHRCPLKQLSWRDTVGLIHLAAAESWPKTGAPVRRLYIENLLAEEEKGQRCVIYLQSSHRFKTEMRG